MKRHKLPTIGEKFCSKKSPRKNATGQNLDGVLKHN
jgi:hypothetical protein